MDLNTIIEVAHPTTRAQLPVWTAGDAWLAGGTWLFSEPQVHLTRLIDLAYFKWPALTIGDSRLSIAATCTVAQGSFQVIAQGLTFDGESDFLVEVTADELLGVLQRTIEHKWILSGHDGLLRRSCIESYTADSVELIRL